MQPFEKQYQLLVSIIDRVEELDSVTKPSGRDIEAEWRAIDKDLNDVSHEIKFFDYPHNNRLNILSNSRFFNSELFWLGFLT